MYKQLLLLTFSILISSSGRAETLYPGNQISPGKAKAYNFNSSKHSIEQKYDIAFTLNKCEKTASDIEKDASKLLIEGMPVICQPGLPALPYKTFCLALPCDQKNIVINVADTVWVEYGCKLEPAQAPRIDDQTSSESITAIAAYSGFEPTECLTVTDVQIYRGRPIYTFALMPVKYDYNHHKIKVLAHLDASISYINPTGKDLSGRTEQFNLTTANMLRAFDFDSVSQEPERPEAFSSKNVTEDYLIVTTPRYETQARRFADWKRTLGYRTYIETNANWTYSSVDNTVKRYYNDCDNLNNLLIIGTLEDVPSMSFADLPSSIARFASDPKANSYTDAIYACMDGEDDFNPDILFGRLIVNDTIEASCGVNKIINFECNPPSDPSYYDKCFVTGAFEPKGNPNPLGDIEDRIFIRTNEQIRNALLSQDKEVVRIYKAPSSANPMFWTDTPGYWPSNGFNPYDTIPLELRRPTFGWDGNANDIVNSLNDGCFMGVYRGHGTETQWWNIGFGTNHLEQLTNQWCQPIILSMTCSSGSLINPNCLASKMTRQRCGSIGVLAASSLSYSGFNDALSLGMVDAIWPMAGLRREIDNDSLTCLSKFRVGDILSQGHLRCGENLGNPY